MAHETPSPIVLPVAPLDQPGLGWTSAVIAMATIVLLAANAVSLSDWIDDLPPSPPQAQASAVANGWAGITDAVGIGRPRAWLHDLWKTAEAARF